MTTPTVAPSAPAPAQAPSNPPPSAPAQAQNTPDLVPGTGAAPAQDSNPGATPSPRRIKFDVGGKVQEYDLDSADPNELSTHLARSHAAQQYIEQARQERARVQEVLELFKKNPFEAAKYLEVDLDKAAEQRLVERYKMQTMTPEQRQAYELQQKYKQLEEKLQGYEQKEKTTAQQIQEQKYMDHYSKTFGEALKKTGLQGSPDLLVRMAEIAKMNLELGINLTPEQLAVETKRHISDLSRPMLRSMSDDGLVEWLGPETVKRVLKHSVTKLKGTGPKPFNTPPSENPVQEPKRDNVLSYEEQRNRLLFGR